MELFCITHLDMFCGLHLGLMLIIGLGLVKHSFGLTLILTLFLGFVQSQTAGNAEERSISSPECAYGCISLSSLGLACPPPLSCDMIMQTFVSSLCIYSFLFKSKAITATTKTTSSTCAASHCIWNTSFLLKACSLK